MPIKLHIDQEKELGTFLVNGVMYFDMFHEAILKFYEGKDFKPTKHILWDLRNAKIDQLRSKEAEDLAFFAASIDKRMDIGKTAIVASGDLVYGVARIFEAHINNPNIQLEVFRSIDEAMKWIDSE